jgi:hypothetical protein
VATLGDVVHVDREAELVTIEWEDGSGQQASVGELDRLLLRRGNLVGHSIAAVRAWSPPQEAAPWQHGQLPHEGYTANTCLGTQQEVASPHEPRHLRRAACI